MVSKLSGPARTALAAAVVGALVLGVIAAAANFSIAKGTSDVAAEGTRGILSEATLSAAAATRNATAQTQVIAEGEALGVAASSDLAISIDRAEEAIRELTSRADQLRDEIGDQSAATVAAETQAVADAATQTLSAITSGDLTQSIEHLHEVDSSYEILVTNLAELRNDAFSGMTIAREEAGRLADAARFLVVLLVPFAILLAYRTRTRRAQQQNDLESELEKEQAVSRTKSEFISHISHQLRTPLTSIYGSALALSDPSTCPDGALTHELTSLITEESAELARMVEDLLAVAAEDQGRLHIELMTTDPVAEIEGVLQPLDLVGYKTDRSLRSASVLADPRHLRQVVSNLVFNAHRHGAQPIKIAGRVGTDDYTIEVTDAGPGIDP
ncbi:MAG: HAMP domain-containing sensor histidine kinase, partial [Acidimicrobiia bacterium]|nr:HAMP domain-containing sensor histidine kinase [Acidimicrobiia bacterium]